MAFFSYRIDPDASACWQMELRAVSDWSNVTGTSVTGRWPNRSPLGQRWSTCSPENQTWRSWSAAEDPQCCVRWGTEGKVKVLSWPTFEVETTFSFSLIGFNFIFLVLYLDLCKTTQKGAACSPTLLKRYKRGYERLKQILGGNRTATVRCRWGWSLSICQSSLD